MGIVEGEGAQPGVQCGSFRLVGVADGRKTGHQLGHRRSDGGLRTPALHLPRQLVGNAHPSVRRADQRSACRQQLIELVGAQLPTPDVGPPAGIAQLLQAEGPGGGRA